MKKQVFIILGFISILCGLFGIFVPILPTTPFLLLAAYFFAKSSPKFYNWLINSKLFGPYIKNYREKRGMLIIHKILVLILLWSVILTTVIYGTQQIWLRILLVTVAIAVSAHIFMIKTLKGEIYAENRTAAVEQETN